MCKRTWFNMLAKGIYYMRHRQFSFYLKLYLAIHSFIVHLNRVKTTLTCTLVIYTCMKFSTNAAGLLFTKVINIFFKLTKSISRIIFIAKWLLEIGENYKWLILGKCIKQSYTIMVIEFQWRSLYKHYYIILLLVTSNKENPIL